MLDKIKKFSSKLVDQLSQEAILETTDPRYLRQQTERLVQYGQWQEAIAFLAESGYPHPHKAIVGLQKHNPDWIPNGLKMLLASGQWQKGAGGLVQMGFDKPQVGSIIKAYYNAYPAQCPATAKGNVLPAQVSAPVAQPVPINQVQLQDWAEIRNMFTAIAFWGEPGTGKTCSMLKFLHDLIQDLGGEAEVIVFDLHDEPGKWGDLKVLSEINEIIRYMQWMLESEFEKRKHERKTKGIQHHPKIWVIDEAGAIQRQCDRKAQDLKYESDVARVDGDRHCAAELLRESFLVKQLPARFRETFACEGRKYNYFGVEGNQIASAKGNGVEGKGDVLEGYVKVYLGRVAHKWAKLMGVDEVSRKWLEQQAYPVLLDGKPALHLTHSIYTTRERNQPPIGLVPLESLAVYEPPEDYGSKTVKGFDCEGALRRSLELAFSLKSGIKKKVILDVLGYSTRDYEQGKNHLEKLVGKQTLENLGAE